MAIHINPVVAAEMEVAQVLRGAVPVERQAEVLALIVATIKKALEEERMLIGAHDDCGANNPDGIAALCKCSCHKGHYRHAWTPVIKTPALNPDGTYHLLDRCKYCPDIRLKVIKAAWVKERQEVVSMEFHVRGEQRVLTREEWQSREPKPQDMTLIRRAGL